MSTSQNKAKFVLIPLLIAALVGGYVFLRDTSGTGEPQVSQAEGVIVEEVVGHQEQPDADVTTAVDEEAPHSSDCAHCQAQQTSADAEPVLSTKSELDHIFKDLAGQKDRIIPKSTFDFFKGSRIGEKASVEIAGQTYEGRVSVVRENHQLARTYGMTLQDNLGALMVSTDGGGFMRGHLLFEGDSRAITFQEVDLGAAVNDEPSLVFFENKVSDIFCAPPDAVYNGRGVSSPTASAAPSQEAATIESLPLGSVFVSALESAPSSEYVLYLDFDGEVVTNTVWNITDLGDLNDNQLELLDVNNLDDDVYPPIVALPLARADEEEWVELVWRRVVEDFAPFEINVTTDRAVFDAADADKRVQAVITSTTTVTQSGVAILYSFREDSPIVWVVKSDEAICASTISHEAGHAFGLRHDSEVGLAPPNDYYFGHNGTYEPGWAPIMGAFFGDDLDDEVDQWSIGEYPNANNVEDDIAIIGDITDPQEGVDEEDWIALLGSQALYDLLYPTGVSISNGFGFKPDDVSDTIAGATDLIITGENLVEGAKPYFIGTRGDVDVFRFVAPEGDLAFVVSPLDVDSPYTESGSESAGANLAAYIELLDSNGDIIAVGQETGGNLLSSALRTFVTSGIYYLRVDGAGRGANADTGFSDYGSLGEYTVSGELDLPPLIVYGGDKQTNSIFNGDTGVNAANGTDFGFSTPSVKVTNVFLLENLGTVLDINNITVSLASGANFEIEEPLPTGPISPEGAKELIISYKPTSTGLHEDIVTIEYLGAELETYTFTVRGVATISETEDNYESNNNSLSAYDVSNFENVFLSNIEGPGFFLSDNVDFYSFTTEPGDGLVQVEFFLYQLGNVKFELYAMAGGGPELVQTSNSFFGTLQYVIPDTYGGAAVEFLVRVENLDDISVRNEYDFQWSAVPLVVGDDDFYEDNDSLSKAFDLTGNEGSLSDYLLPAILSDEDWYQITIPEDPFARMLYISALFEHAQGNIDIEVIKDGEIIASSLTEDDKETLTIHDAIELNSFESVVQFEPTSNTIVMGVVPGTYYIHVFGDYAGNTYDLIVERLRDDRYEEGTADPETENDTFGTAFDLGETILGKWLSEVDGVGTVADYEIGATVAEFENAGDVDWYQFSVPAGEVVEQITLDYEFFDGGVGFVEFAIVNEFGDIIATSADSVTLSGTLTVSNPTSFNYWIRVEATDSRQWLSGYDFRVDFSAEPPFIQDPLEDNYEQNDFSTKPFNISNNEGRWLSSLDGYGTQLDDDWYRITIPDDAVRLEVTLFHFAVDGDMLIRLARDPGGLLFTSDVGGNTESIIWDNPEILGSNSFLIGVSGENRGNFYNLFWDVTRFEDNYEVNNSLAQATDLTGFEGRFLNKLNGLGIQRDPDWYRISADADTEELRVEVSFTHSEGDIDIALINPTGSIIQRSVSTTDNEQLVYSNPPAGDYFVRVDYGDAGNEYDLVWYSSSQAELAQIPLEDDLYEVHREFTDNNTAERAFVLGENENRLSALEQGLGIQKDDDWYQIEIPNDNVGLRVECLFTDADGDIDMEIYDPLGFPVAIRDSITDDEIFDVRSRVPAGIYQIRVYGANLGNEYDLYWNAFVEDIYEENDKSGEAANVDFELGGPLQNPTLGDDDWYVFSATGDEPFIRVDLSYIDANGAIDFQILDQNFNPVVTAESTEDTELELVQVTAGTYYVFVYGENLYNPYEMTISVIGDDEFEDNDFSDDAADITLTPDILAVQFDTDWFKFEVTEFDTFLSVIASFTHANGNVDLALFADDGFGNPDLANPLGVSETELNNESVRVEGSPGVYFIRVTGDNINQRYRLIWTTSPDDEFEQNDEFIESQEITGLEGTAINGIQFDEDWFYVDVAPGNIRLNVELDFINEEGDLSLAIFDADEEGLARELASVDTEADGEQIILPIFPFATEDQRFYIRVAGTSAGSSYQLTWNASKEDDFEGENGNNSIENASDDLLGSEGVRISTTIGYAGAVNDDWYAIPVNSGDDGIVIELFYIHTVDHNVEMELFDKNNTFLRRSTGETGVERIHFTNNASQGTTYYLHVYGSNSENPYDLIWNSYSEDNLEIGVESGNTPNNPPDNDDPDTPRGLLYPTENIGTRGTRDLEFIKLEGVTQLDEDWYHVQVQPGENIFIANIEFVHAQGDIDMALYFRDGENYTLVEQAVSQDDNEQIRKPNLPPGDYLICVYGYGIANPKTIPGWSFDPATQNYSSIERRTEDVDDGGDNFNLSQFDLDENIAYGLANTYSLQWLSSVEDQFDEPTAPVGVNDTLDFAAFPDLVDQFGDDDEDNVIDDVERTRTVINGAGQSIEFPYRRVFTFSGLAQFDEDWYRFDVNTQGIFLASIFYNSQHGDLRMSLYDANGEPVITDVSNAFRIDNFGLNTYYLQVVGNDLGVPYTLELTGAEDDPYEQNDNLGEADVNANITDLAGGALPNSFIQRDIDIFRIDIPDDQVHLNVRVDPGLTVVVLDALGNPLPAGFEQSGRTEASNQAFIAEGVISPEGATYYIRVTGNNFGAPYTLYWDFDAIDDYEFRFNDDVLVPNNDAATATTTNSNLSRYRLEPLWLPGNQRNFEYQPPIQELAFDYSLLGSVQLNTPYFDPFGHATQYDDDWYAIQIPSWREASARKGNKSVDVLKRIYHTRMSAEIEFTHTDGDINMEIWEDDPNSLGSLRLLARAETTSDIEKLNVAIDPTDEDRFYYIRVYGDNAGNDYSLKWDFSAEDAYERLEDEDLSNDENRFVDRAFDLTNADGNSTEDTWLHEIEYLQDVDGDDDIDAQDGGVTSRLGYGEQTDTDDWYAVVVSEGATQIQVECIAYSDNDINYTYNLDNLDIDFEVYYLSGNDGDPNTIDLRKPVLIGRSDSDTDNGLFVGVGAEKDELTEDITTPITEGPAVFDVVEPGIYFIRIYYDNRDHPYTFKWDDLGDTDNSGDAAIIQDYLFGNWRIDLTDSTLPELLQVPFANSDGDRWPNWAEYALGLDGEVADYVVLGQDIVDVEGVDYYQFDYLRHKDAKAMGFVFTVEESEDLIFDGTEPIFTSAENVGDDMERVYYRSTNPVNAQDKCFFRLSVDPPDSF